MPMAIEERVESLESILGHFMTSTDVALTRLEREMRAYREDTQLFKDEMREFKDEMRAFKDEQARGFAAMNRKWGELANKMGTVVEDIVAPNIPTIAARYFGCETLEIFAVRYRRMQPGKPDVVREFDVIAVADDKFLVNETKSTPRSDYLERFVETMPEVFDYFPEHADKTLIPVFSSLSIPAEAVAYLTKHGVYAMAMTGDTMDLLNFEQIGGTQ
jgi:hypothetical protein